MAPPNIVWITLDSVRADHTSLGDYRRDTTPNMAELGDSGTTFRSCIAHSKSTLPSSGAILTGYTPSRNTLGIEGNVLPESVPTIPERFSELGYRTACLSRNSYVSSATGLDRGFDRFQWLSSSTIRSVGPRTLLKYLLNIRRHSAGLTLDTAKHASPYLMNETAKGWLDDFAADGDPFFFYLHYNEPHRPYYPPLSYLDKYADDLSMSAEEAAAFALDVHYNMEEYVANGCEFTDDEWDALVAMYDAETAYTDMMVGKLVEYVRSLPLDDTVVVVTADHGELFGEYGLLSHRYVLHDAVTHVPMVIDGLETDLAAGSDDIVQHADVMATLLAMAGGDHEDLMGRDLREESREFAISQREPTTLDSITQHNPSFDTSWFHEGLLTALRTEAHRFQRSEGRTELFELPDERTDVAADRPELAAELGSTLESWMETHGTPATDAETGEFSGAVQRQLEDLGYLD
ncbi:sulfatase [Haloarcula laminariae]|uniref:sulfatase n=1 Tax=Haloarcula laminariae TaxID=2961577 RepID=UPI0024067B6D|nr:sulfatase [Halomicroarcula sp. FL173]